MKLNRFTRASTDADEEFYSQSQVAELFENDELTAGEEGFMSGYLRAY